MTPAEQELRAAVRALKRAPVGRRAAARARIREAIVAVVKEDMPRTQITEISGYSRERIRQIARAAGIEAPPEQAAKGAKPKTPPVGESESGES
jgi:uncharacterized protein (DUF362 family)